MKKLFITLGVFAIIFGSLAFLNGRFVPQLPEIYQTEDNATEEERQQALENELKAQEISFAITIAKFEKQLNKLDQIGLMTGKNVARFDSPYFNIYYRSPTSDLNSNLETVYVEFKEENPVENEALMTDFHIVMAAILQVIDPSVTYDFEKIEPLFTVEPSGANSEITLIYGEQIKLLSLFNGANMSGQQFMEIRVLPIAAN